MFNKTLLQSLPPGVTTSLQLTLIQIRNKYFLASLDFFERNQSQCSVIVLELYLSIWSTAMIYHTLKGVEATSLCIQERFTCYLQQIKAILLIKRKGKGYELKTNFYLIGRISYQ